MEDIEDFFQGCDVMNVRIIEDREMQRPKGFAYVEFNEQDGLKKALDRDGEQINGRYVKVKVADSREFLLPRMTVSCPPSCGHLTVAHIRASHV